MHEEHLYFCGETNSINLTRERGPTKANCVTFFMKYYIFIIFWAPFHPNSQVIDDISQYKAELTFNRKKLLTEILNWCMIRTNYIFVTVLSCQRPQKLFMTNPFYLPQIFVYIIENLRKEALEITGQVWRLSITNPASVSYIIIRKKPIIPSKHSPFNRNDSKLHQMEYSK